MPGIAAVCSIAAAAAALRRVGRRRLLAKRRRLTMRHCSAQQQDICSQQGMPAVTAHRLQLQLSVSNKGPATLLVAWAAGWSATCGSMFWLSCNSILVHKRWAPAAVGAFRGHASRAHMVHHSLHIPTNMAAEAEHLLGDKRTSCFCCAVLCCAGAAAS